MYRQTLGWSQTKATILSAPCLDLASETHMHSAALQFTTLLPTRRCSTMLACCATCEKSGLSAVYQLFTCLPKNKGLRNTTQANVRINHTNSVHVVTRKRLVLQGAHLAPAPQNFSHKLLRVCEVCRGRSRATPRS